ncbi:MAG TPA: metal ABC transporter ATP-binding protein [Anaerolineales bacterium]|nr:metal ABC transporter ATP-binding protein [Anaerolineales bacterium]
MRPIAEVMQHLKKANWLQRHAPHQPGTPILDVSRVSVRYNGQEVLEEVSFQLRPGQRVAVVGPNGAGKSTLFKVIAGVLAPSAGQVQVFGGGPGGHICIAYLPQRSHVDWDFPVSVADVVMMGRIGKMGPLRWPRPRDWQLVHQSLELVGLGQLATRQIGELSGGQQQRMFIARALAQEAELMLMDEPFTGLDVPSQEDIFNNLDRLGQRGVTVLVAMHDLKLAAERFERVMLLNHALLGFGEPQEIFTPERLISAYGGHLHLIGKGEALLALGDTCCDEGLP